MSITRSFTTTRLPHAERTRAWSDYVNHSLLDAKIQPFHESGIDAESHTRLIGDLTLVASRSNEHALQRTPESVALDPKRKLFVSAIVQGSAMLYQPGAVHTIAPGEVLIYSSDRPYMIAFQPSTSQVFAELPEETFSARFNVTIPAIARKANIGRSRAAADLRGLASDIVSHSTPDGDLHDRFSTLLEHVAEIGFPDHGSIALSRAKGFIDGNASDPELTPSLVAAHVHLSLRHLNRLFATEGTTIARYLAEVRTLNARRLLAEAALPLSDIAAVCGFGSVSTLSRHVRG